MVAARVGGLPTAVADGVSGVLVDGHDPDVWAATLCRAVADPLVLQRMSQAAVGHAAGFGSSIRKEWEWRLSRGEPTHNLEAFRHLAPPDA